MGFLSGMFSNSLSACIDRLNAEPPSAIKVADSLVGMLLHGIEEISKGNGKEHIALIYKIEAAGEAKFGAKDDDFCVMAITRNFLVALEKGCKSPYNATFEHVLNFLADWAPVDAYRYVLEAIHEGEFKSCDVGLRLDKMRI